MISFSPEWTLSLPRTAGASFDALVAEWSAPMSSVSPGEWAGRVVFHGTSVAGAEDIAARGVDQSKSTKGYFGRGFYTTPDASLALSNYADWAEEDARGAVLAVRISPAARIFDLRDAADWGEYAKISKNGGLVSLDGFDRIMVRAGIDGLADRSFEGVVIYNPSAVSVAASSGDEE